MTVDKLHQRFRELSATKAVLAGLRDVPVAQKRAEVYPPLVELVTRYLCREAPPSLHSLDATLKFLARERAHEPELVARLYAAIGTTPVRFGREQLFDLLIAVRDRRGIPLLADGSVQPNWAEAVLALHADTEIAELTRLVRNGASSETAVACGIVAGEAAREALHLGARRDNANALGLAFLADPADADYFAKLGRTPNETAARRVHTALTARGPVQRRNALGELADALASAHQPAWIEQLMAATLALDDARPEVVERASTILGAYATTQQAKMRMVFFPAFLERATRAVERGVTGATRTALEAVWRYIPHPPAIPAGKTVARPATRKATAKAKGAELVEAMRDVVATATGERDAAIEAQIAASPDDPAAYLVYADWLQTRGDPRGAWITLHSVKGLAAREAIKAFLGEHRAAVLGGIEPFVEREHALLEVEWFMGFVRSARISEYADARLLRALLEAPCGAFVQEVVFANAVARADVIALLRELRPPALARLAFGVDDDPPAELVEVMPRLRRDPLERWRAALARVDEHRKPRGGSDVEDVPPLVPAPGVTVDVDLAKVLHGLRLELHLDHPIGLVAVIPEVFTAASVDRFARALVEAWANAGFADRARWGFRAAGALGGRDTARYLGAHLGELGSRERVAEALAHLAQIGTPVAIEEIAAAAYDPAADHRLRDAARQALATLAEAPGEADGVIARAAPAPEPRSAQVQRWWLEALMVDGRALALADFRAMLGDPLRLAAARTLLWAERAHDGTIAGMFRVDEHGTPVRRDGTPYPARLRIGLVHPAELSESELAGARRAFARVDQAILQLERPVFGLAADEARTTGLTRFVKRRVGFAPISETLRARGWYVAAGDYEPDWDDEQRWVGTRAFARAFPRDGALHVVATLNETRGSIALVRALHGATERTFDDLHVVTISELLWDLETAHGRPAPIAAPPPPPEPIAPAPAPAPVVERAKSGRSKCVVCTQAIAKDAWRVGVERLVETPTFRGRATVWLHPGCRDGAPELAGVALPPTD